MINILATDIGATKTIICICSNKKILHKKTYSSKNYPSFYRILNDFLCGIDAPLNSACFAIAGPISNNRCKVTNLPWVIEGNKLAKILRTKRVILINDFESIGNGIAVLERKDLVKLNNATPLPGKPKAVIGAGTGLGETIIYWDSKNGYSVMPSEGGHCEFSSTNNIEWELKRFLVRKYGFAEWESVLSGPGLANIYEFLTGKRKSPEEITADYERNKQPKQAVNMFVSFYARESANLALKVIPLGGLYIAGNIANQLLPLFRRKSFIKEFIGNGKMKSLLERVPLFVVTNTEVGLIGAIKYGLINYES